MENQTASYLGTGCLITALVTAYLSRLAHQWWAIRQPVIVRQYLLMKALRYSEIHCEQFETAAVALAKRVSYKSGSKVQQNSLQV
jgi:hypothetical protein